MQTPTINKPNLAIQSFESKAGIFSLVRPGADGQKSLQAWDAADSYLIEHTLTELAASKVAVFNDQFGALGVCLNDQINYWVSDSFCAHNALNQNLEMNNLAATYPRFTPLEAWNCDSKTDVALIKLPKNLSFLTHLIQRCNDHHIPVICIAGMMKHLPKNILVFLQKFGQVDRQPFKKKATIYQLTLAPSKIEKIKQDYPKQLNFNGIQLHTHANVFGRDKLDPGAAFILEHLKTLPKGSHVADLCCGSGILGIAYAKQYPDASVRFFDESNMAVRSSQASCEVNEIKEFDTFWDDGLKNSNHKFDLIICNPPFHEEHTVGDHIAKRLFNDARNNLKANGSLIVIGNRHLGYHITLKKYFKKINTLASNAKFVLLKAHD